MRRPLLYSRDDTRRNPEPLPSQQANEARDGRCSESQTPVTAALRSSASKSSLVAAHGALCDLSAALDGARFALFAAPGVVRFCLSDAPDAFLCGPRAVLADARSRSAQSELVVLLSASASDVVKHDRGHRYRQCR